MSEIVPGELLNEARRLLESGWCQGAYCRSGMGREVALGSPWAKFWDPSGAVWKAAQRAGIQSKRHPAFARSLGILVELCRARGFTAASHEVVDWNDAPERTQEEVLALLDEAIRLASPFVVLVGPQEEKD